MQKTSLGQNATGQNALWHFSRGIFFYSGILSGQRRKQREEPASLPQLDRSSTKFYVKYAGGPKHLRCVPPPQKKSYKTCRCFFYAEIIFKAVYLGSRWIVGASNFYTSFFL